ncbi:zinc-binding metallopeptidase family protein [Octadecabacter antarcticus]|uniref:hypothetical protein n=1 Tax=Octadecabacter antarcticus TaxID=1217908 RepID=UPI0001806250|nr:hypothetical protein [Octadecabacter antarcticus]
MSVSAAQKTATAWVEAASGGLSADCAQIFDFAEPAWREYRSCAWYVERLRAEGFTVQEGSGGMPTAFCAEWSNGAGPVVGMYAEYDAVPGNCQAASVHEAPHVGLSHHAAGHTDPHSALGISGLGGLLATKAAMERHGIKGGLRFTGEPAEKVLLGQSRSMPRRGITTGWRACCHSTRSTCCRCAIRCAGTRTVAPPIQ